jgi:hypothetical protein
MWQGRNWPVTTGIRIDSEGRLMKPKVQDSKQWPWQVLDLEPIHLVVVWWCGGQPGQHATQGGIRPAIGRHPRWPNRQPRDLQVIE